MKKLKGIVSSKGIVLGKCKVINNNVICETPSLINDVDSEIDKFLVAQKKSIDQLEFLYHSSILTISEKNAMIFKSHQVMIQDQDFVDKVFYYINVFKYNVAYAIFKAAQDYILLLKNLKSEYISQRVDDIKDIMHRLINNISDNNDENDFDIDEECILFTQDLMPSRILTVDKNKVLGIVDKCGGQTSHASILARSMDIPMIVGVNFDFKEVDGKFVILDGILGKVIISPDNDTVNEYLKKQEKLVKDKQALKSLLELASFTMDKREIKVVANVISSDSVSEAIKNGAQGIGLFRSEFLYINRNNLPLEEELFNEYKSALMAAKGKEVVIRTIDIGSDKGVSYISCNKETNPALGLRALRLCFDHLDIFKAQLRALIRASAYGRLCILIPMVISVLEVMKVKEIIDEIKTSLSNKKIPFNTYIPLGVMIETPSSVMISDLLARQVDFFSIGTNDLIQYTLACDRDNSKLSDIYHLNHISILRMIKNVVDNAHKNNIWVEVCGEAAGDLNMTDKLVGLGVDRLSVDIHNLLYVKDKVTHINYEQVRENILNVIGSN